MRHLFDFSGFVNERRANPETKEKIDNYEEYVEPLDGIKDVKDTQFYKDYLSHFNLPEDWNLELKVSEYIDDDQFDYDLLFRLVLGSFSSEYSLSIAEESKQDTDSKMDLIMEITVKSESQTVTKRLDELWSFQVHRLYEIYVAEQMDLAVKRKKEDASEDIDDERQLHIERFKAWLDGPPRVVMGNKKLNRFFEDL